MLRDFFNSDQCHFFGLGRNAMYAGCKALGLKAGDEVLTPAFDCDGSLHPFRVLNLKLNFFRVDPYTWNVDVDSLKRCITSRTKLIHIINYFGMPQPWSDIMAFRKETGIPILEDNAYTFLSSYEGKLLGSFGDISIFSLRKSLMLVDGGILRINLPDISLLEPMDDSRWIYPTEIGLLVKWLMSRIGMNGLIRVVRPMVRTLKPQFAPPPTLYSDDVKFPMVLDRDVIGKDFSSNYRRPISRFARWQWNALGDADIKKLAEARRGHYKYLVEQLSDVSGIQTLWPKLPKGAVPTTFSFLVKKKRDSLFERLRKKYDLMVWPTLSYQVLDRLHEFPEVSLLGKQLLQFNLPFEHVRKPNFDTCVENFIHDVRIHYAS